MTVPRTDTGEASDAELLAAHTSGDRYAFDTLVRRHRDRLWAVALRTLRDVDEAADALQDALISAYRNAASFRAEAAVTTWLHRIVVNSCLDRVRRRQAKPTVALPEGPGEPAEVRDAVAERDTAMAIEDALGQLPTEQRAAIVLVDIHGYSVAEAARMLDVAEGTIKSRCARGRAKLAGFLGGLRNPDLDSAVRTTQPTQETPHPTRARSAGSPRPQNNAARRVDGD